MKKTLYMLFATILIVSCHNRNDDPKPVAELEKLPLATQSGNNTIGCLLDGKAFLPGNYQNSTNCFYQFVNGDYYFSMSFSNKDSNFNLTGLALNTNKKKISANITYDLYEPIEGSVSGLYIYNAIDPQYTSHTHTGKMTITKLDPVNYIVSGTFWYDIQDTSGIVHHITDGRFDFHYTN